MPQLPILSLDTAKGAVGSAMEVDRYSLAEAGLTTIGVVAPTLLNRILADDIYRNIRPYMTDDQTAARMSLVACNVIAVLLGIFLIYVGYAKGSDKLYYVGVPIIGANLLWIGNMLVTGE